jgi:hypothetical protein
MKTQTLQLEPLEARHLMTGFGADPQLEQAGDANLDGVYDRDDVVQVLQAGKYNTGQSASWHEGDWNGDGVFNQLDIVEAQVDGTYGVSPLPTLAGTWALTGPGGLTELRIRGRSGSYNVQGFGACVPTACDWGTVPLETFGESVSDHVPRFGMATWDFGFKETHLTIRPQADTFLVELFDIYKDGSGRNDRHSFYRLDGLGGMTELAPSDQVLPLSGRFENVDPNTGGLTALELSSDTSGQKVQGFGACSPTECDWGDVSMNVLGNSISDSTPRVGLATWEHGFATTHITLRAQRPGVLIAEKYTIFHDGSGRANYRQTYSLKSVGPFLRVIDTALEDLFELSPVATL